MRAIDQRRGFTLAEIAVSVTAAALLVGLVTMSLRVSVQTRNQRADQVAAMMEAREALDTIDRLVSRAVEIKEWDASNNIPRLSDATGEAGDSFLVGKPSTGPGLNLGSGFKTFAIGDVIVHNGISWNVERHKTVDWNSRTDSPTLASGGLLDTYRVTPSAATAPAVPWPAGMPTPVPTGGWSTGDILVKRAAGWTHGSVRLVVPAPTGAFPDYPPITDATGAVGDVYAVNVVQNPAVPLAPNAVFVPLASRNFGSGLMPLVTGDHIVRTPSGWRKLAYQCSIRNFKSLTTNADDNTNGIQFYADVDPVTPYTNNLIPGTADLDIGPTDNPFARERRKILEWVWIWWDSAQDIDQVDRAPYERRGPVKVAIFRNKPYGAVLNSHDFWTRSSHSFFKLINSSAYAGQKAYFTTAANFGEMQMKVQSFVAPTAGNAAFTWRKRVAVTAGVFLDRTGELAQLGTNSWDEVAPGSQFLLGAQSRFHHIPSYTFCRSIYAANADAVVDGSTTPATLVPLSPGHPGWPFAFDPNASNNQTTIRDRSVGWQTGFAAGNIKNDYVVQPR